MLRVLELLAKQSANHLETACQLRVTGTRLAEGFEPADAASPRHVVIGLGGDEAGLLTFAFSEGIAAHLANYLLEQKLSVANEADLADALMEVASMLLAGTLRTLRGRGVAFQAGPAVGGGPARYHHLCRNDIQHHTMVMETDQGALVCHLAVRTAVPVPVAADPLDPVTPKLLVVDDCSLIRSIIERSARRVGCEVQCVHNGPAALVALEAFEPDLVTLDLVMPGMDGLTCLQQIKKLQPETRVLMLSGIEDEDSWELAREYGASAFLHKPFRAQELENELRDLVAPPTLPPIPVH